MNDESMQADNESPRMSTMRIRPTMPADAFEVRSVPLPVEGSKREVWKLSTLVLCLSYCRANSATLEQINVLTWALRDESNAAEFERVWREESEFRILRAWDDSTLRTLRIGIMVELVMWTGSSRIKLTEKGLDLSKKIRSEVDSFADEKAFLSSFRSFSASGMWSHLGEISSAQRSHLKDSQ